MQLKTRQTRAIALLTGGVLAATTLFYSAPAQADKAKTYKYGAIGLGVLGAYMLSKGKTVPGAAVVAGGVYAYKKSRDAQRNDRYDDHRYDRYGSGSNDSSYNSNYPQYNSNYGDYNSAYPRTNANAQYNPRYENRDGGHGEQCRDNDRDQRDSRRENHRDKRRGNDRNNYDLSPYLR